MAFKNYYILLGVKNSASLEEVKLAFRQLAKKYHPDKNQGNKPAEDFFKELQEAYETLSNPEKRKTYDQKFMYSSQYQQVKNVRYSGNAYQFAQQQARSNPRHQAQSADRESAKTNLKDEKKDSDSYFFVISIVVAILLLIFIISYSAKGSMLSSPFYKTAIPMH